MTNSNDTSNYKCGVCTTGERSSMKKFTNEELTTMALEVYEEFKNEIPEEKREESLSLSIVNVSLNAMVKFIAKLQENDN